METTATTATRRGQSTYLIIFAALGVLGLGSVSAFGRVVESFTPATASAWQPYQQAPTPTPAANGVSFPLPFSRSVDRAAWDKPITANFSAAVAFDVELSCPDASAVRAMGLYFKSGNGWFVASRPLINDGPQTLLFSKSDFSTEGTPAGWDRIEGIRLSPWKGPSGRDTTLVMHRLSTIEGSLVLVRGTSSCPDAGARAVASRTTDRISRLLMDAGIGHTIVTDDDLTKGALRSARAALLPYNPNPTPAQLKALMDFLKRGGKLGVFYGASPALANAMGFRLGPYIKAERPDRWRSIVFADPGEWLVAPRIWQNSPNLMPAHPAGSGSRVIAFWENARGERQPEPAIAVSARGFWMSHILMGDDAQAKTEMLVSLCGHLDPTLWAPAAQRAAQAAGRINAYHGLGHALASIRRQLPAAARPEQTAALLNQVESLIAQIQASLTAGRHKEALVLVRRQRRLLLRADSAVQVPRPGEMIGVWDHDGTGFVPGDWVQTANYLAAHGVNAIFPNVVWGGCAHYPSRHLPASNTLRLYGDQIAAGLAAARARGMQYHVWMVLWKLDGAPADFTERMRKEGRLQISDTGATRPWLSPHHPANRRLVLDVVEEIARNYPDIDGIHLDYIRLPDAQSCFAPTTRARFESATRRKTRNWPADVRRGGPRYAEFRQWRANDMTALVADIRARLRTVAPRQKLSAAVWGITHPDGGNIGQAWADWLKAGTVDFVVPMNYTESHAEFAHWLRTQTAYPGAAGRIYAGIGISANESRLDSAQVIRQIILARQAGCPGVVLFQLNGTLRDEILPALREGLTRPSP